MKFTSSLLFSLVADAGEKKVPPRSPAARLRTLRRFAREWLDTNFATAEGECCNKMAVRYNEFFKNRFENWGERLKSRVDQNCYYFDPDNVTGHGGRPKRSTNGTDGEYDYDDYSDYDTSSDLIRYNKLNPTTGLRQIMTGYRKWSIRYIDMCPGERDRKAHSNRARDIHKKILGKYLKFREAIERGSPKQN